MRTKFAVILKVKKDILSKIERELMAINSAIAQKKLDIIALRAQIKDIKIPQISVYRELLRFKDHIAALESAIEAENNLLALMESSKIDISKRYKAALIEYEKVNYLHLQEVEAWRKKLAKQEQKVLDDIAGILYHRAGNSAQWEG